MKKVLIVSILVLIVVGVYNYIDGQLQAYYNTQVTIEMSERCQQDVQNGMPVEFCD